MHQYKILFFDYTEEGAPTNREHHVYCNTPEELLNEYNRISGMRYENGWKMYKVTVLTAVYKPIPDVDAFFAEYQV